MGKEFKRHFTVNHAKGEYAKGFASTNTVEDYFSIFRRGMIRTYQHCGEQHLQRYFKEFDFRYSNRKISDKERAVEALKGAEGKRLMYRRSRPKKKRITRKQFRGAKLVHTIPICAQTATQIDSQLQRD